MFYICMCPFVVGHFGKDVIGVESNDKDWCCCSRDPHCYQFDSPKQGMENAVTLAGPCRRTLLQNSCDADVHLEDTFAIVAWFLQVGQSDRWYIREICVTYQYCEKDGPYCNYISVVRTAQNLYLILILYSSSKFIFIPAHF